MLLTKVRATQIIIFYPLVAAITLIVVTFVKVAWIVPVAGFIIGWTAAGGVLQLVTSTANSLFPQARGLMTSLVMIASAVGGFAFQSLAAPWVVSAPGNVLLLNAGVTLVGVVLAIFVDRAEKSRLARTPARVAVNA